MSDTWMVIVSLAAVTFLIRFSGVILGERLPQHGPWARGLQALPGCLIVSLVTVLLIGGGPLEWLAGAICAVTALLTRNLPLTMVVGIASIYLLRLVVG